MTGIFAKPGISPHNLSKPLSWSCNCNDSWVNIDLTRRRLLERARTYPLVRSACWKSKYLLIKIVNDCELSGRQIYAKQIRETTGATAAWSEAAVAINVASAQFVCKSWLLSLCMSEKEPVANLCAHLAQIISYWLCSKDFVHLTGSACVYSTCCCPHILRQTGGQVLWCTLVAVKLR